MAQLLSNKQEQYVSQLQEMAYGYNEVKKSKFHCYLYANITSKEQIQDYMSAIKNKHKKARHIVYAYEYSLDGVVYRRYSNDGEPQGTGVNAIMTMLMQDKITNYLVIIVRYFGGTLLR